MRLSLAFALFVTLALVLTASDSAASKVQAGKLSVATLLATQRISGKGAPDGIRFLFLVDRKPEAKGEFTLKETRDFLLNGESYQEMSHAELGKAIEPATVFDTASAFFAKNPGARHLAPKDIEGAYILTIAIAGAKIKGPTAGEITLYVGFGKDVEPLSFRFLTPPNPSASTK